LRKTKEQYVMTEKDGKPSGWRAYYRDGKWIEEQPKAPARKKKAAARKGPAKRKKAARRKKAAAKKSTSQAGGG
jgi:DNA topoisomerase-1